MAVRVGIPGDIYDNTDLVGELDGEAVKFLSHTELTQVLGGYRIRTLGV